MQQYNPVCNTLFNMWSNSDHLSIQKVFWLLKLHSDTSTFFFTFNSKHILCWKPKVHQNIKQSFNRFFSLIWIKRKLNEWEAWGWKEKMHTGKDRKREKINRWKSHVWSWRCEGKKSRWCLKAAFWTVVLKAINMQLFWSGRLYCLVMYIFFSTVFCIYCTLICISYLCFNTYMTNFETIIDKCCTDRIRAAL